MKYLITITFVIFCTASSFSQDYDFLDIVGVYEGELMPDRNSKHKLVIKEDKSFVFSTKIETLWVGMMTGKLEKDDFYETKSGNVIYQFNIINSPEDYSSFAINILDEKLKTRMKFTGVYVFFNKKGELPFGLDMNRVGGNPVSKPKIAVENFLLNGTTTAWGSYKSEFTSSLSEGAFMYDYVGNFFLCTKKGNDYIISDKSKEVVERVHLKYHYDENTKTLKLKETPTLNAHLYSSSAISNQKKEGKYASDKKAIITALIEQTYALFDEKYKPLDINFKDFENGEGNIIAISSKGDVYIGAAKNNDKDGAGTLFLKNEKQKGHWTQGNKNGVFTVEGRDLVIDAYFENDKKEGTWYFYNENGKITRVTFKNDEKISSKVIRKALDIKISEMPMVLNELMTITQTEMKELRVFNQIFSTFVYENKYDKLTLLEVKEKLQNMITILNELKNTHDDFFNKIEKLQKAAEKGNCSEGVALCQDVKSSNERFLSVVNSSISKSNAATSFNSKSEIREKVFRECFIDVVGSGTIFLNSLEKASQVRCNYEFD